MIWPLSGPHGLTALSGRARCHGLRGGGHDLNRGRRGEGPEGAGPAPPDTRGWPGSRPRGGATSGPVAAPRMTAARIARERPVAPRESCSARALLLDPLLEKALGPFQRFR